MSHTAGTWEITHRFDAEGYPYTIECDGRTIATIAPSGYPTTADEPESNVHLLVVAPQLLGALEDAESTFGELAIALDSMGIGSNLALLARNKVRVAIQGAKT